MKVWRPNVLINFIIDWQRVRLLAKGTRWAFWMNFLIVPACVAWALIQIFITRGAPDTTISNFIFFSVLYLFWMGLFHACTSINGAKEQGEWTYWVLGVRQCEYSVRSYICALTFFQIGQVLIVALAFIVVVFASTFCSADYWAQAIGGPYCYGEVGNFALANNCAIEAYIFGLVGKLTWWARGYFLLYFTCGLFAAGISGVIVGMCVSAWVRKRGYALFTSVCITMVVTLFSVVSLAPSQIEPAVSEEKENWKWGEEFQDCQQSAYFFPIYQLWKMIGLEVKQQGITRMQAIKQIACTPVYYKEHRIATLPSPYFFGEKQQIILNKDEVGTWAEVEKAYLNLKSELRSKNLLEKGVPNQKEMSTILNRELGKCVNWSFYEFCYNSDEGEKFISVLCYQQDGMKNRYYQYPDVSGDDWCNGSNDFPLEVEAREILEGSSWNLIEGEDLPEHLKYEMVAQRKSHFWIKWFQILSFLLPPRYAFNIAHTVIPREGVLSRGNDYYDTKTQRGSACLLREIREHQKKDLRCWCVFCLEMVPSKKFHVDLEDDPFWLSIQTYEVNQGKERAFGLKDRMKYYNEDIRVLKSIWRCFFVGEVFALMIVLGLLRLLLWFKLAMFSEFKQLR